MTSTVSGDLCRITVTGPDKRVDLAVPASTTVAALMPVLLWHTAEMNASDGHGPEGSWVLQRLGGAPFDPKGTAESLDWLEGENLYLRPAADPLPELDFDDLSDGIAAVVNQRSDRWQPQHRRVLFLALTELALALLGAIVLDRYAGATLAGLGFGLAGVLAVVAVTTARLTHDSGVSLVFAVSSCGFAATVALDLADASDGSLSVGEQAVFMAAVAATAASALLVVAQRLWAPAIPYAVVMAVLLLGVEIVAIVWLHRDVDLSWPAAAGLAAATMFAIVAFLPRIALRFARLRGPQLPKTGEELQYDTEPHPAADVQRRANEADQYLSVTTVTISLAMPLLFLFVMREPGWAGWVFVLVMSSALLLRARVFLGLWQRIPLTFAGSAGWVLVTLALARSAMPGWAVVMVCGLVLLAVILVAAALRPWPRRLLPVWEFTATILDMATGLAILPLALQLMHAYAWARGLKG